MFFKPTDLLRAGGAAGLDSNDIAVSARPPSWFETSYRYQVITLPVGSSLKEAESIRPSPCAGPCWPDTRHSPAPTLINLHSTQAPGKGDISILP